MNPSQLLPLLSRFAPLAGFVGILSIVWLMGPTLALGDVRPLAESWQRWLATGLILVGAAVWYLVKWVLTKQREQKLQDAVAGQDQGARAIESRLKAGFDALKRRQRSSGAILAMPWYAVIGAPGTGKTTAIRASGLHFVDRDLVGAEAYKGVGGTRNCNWWLAEEAVLLDTAGRYSYSEAASASDEEEWNHFLATVKRFRPERPVNGVAVFFGLDQLVSLSETELANVIASVSARTREISQAFGLALPVYVVFTKLDRLAGFQELLEDLNDTERRKSLGVALDDVFEPGGVKTAVTEGLSGLVRRMELWIHGEVEREHNLVRTAHMISAPSQLVALTPRIAGVLERLAIDSGEGRHFRLRGLYLLSSVQEGSLFDRVAAELGNAFGIAETGAPEVERGSRALFVEGVFRDAMLPEARLAGTDLKAVRRNIVLRTAAALGIAAAGLLVAIGLSVSYATNRTLVADVSTAADHYLAVAQKPATESEAGALLDRLEAMGGAVGIASQYEPKPPLKAREFLYQGGMLSENAGDIYDRELGQIVGQRLRASLEAGLRQSDASALPLQFEWLKAYLMLDQANTAQRDGGFLQRVAGDLWSREFSGTPTTKDRLLAQLKVMLDRGMHSQTLDPQLVDEIRQRVAGGGNSALVAFIYRSLESQLAIPDGRNLSLGGLLGVDGRRLFRFAANWNENSAIPVLYTKPGAAAFPAGLDKKLKDFAEDGWVLDKYMPSRDVVMGEGIRSEIRKRYAQQYIQTWDAVLQSVTIPPVSGGDVRSKLAVAGAFGTSPVTIFLQNVLPHIDLPLAIAGAPSSASAPMAGDKSPPTAQGVDDPASDPRKLIDDHFKRLAATIRGEGSPSLNDFMGQVQNAATSLGMLQMSTGAGSEGMDPMRAGAMTQVMSSSQTSNAFPAPLSSWHAALMGGALRSTEAIVKQGAASELKAQGSGACGIDVSKLYPFDRESTSDISPSQFAELFASSGSLETFFKTKLADSVDTRDSPWRWKGSSPLRGTLSSGALGQFERARRIREAFFSGGGDRIQIEFALTPIAITTKSAQRLTIRVGQDTFEFSHGPLRRKSITWQANGDVGTPIEIEFDPLPGSGLPAKRSIDGIWSLLRWLDEAKISDTSSGNGIKLNIVADKYSATVLFESRKLEALLAAPDWRNFHCPM